MQPQWISAEKCYCNPGDIIDTYHQNNYAIKIVQATNQGEWGRSTGNQKE